MSALSAVKFKMIKNVVFTFLFILLTSLPPSLQFIDAATVPAKSPYKSGYDHGCTDAGVSDSSAKYINQPEKG
jgi:hypothetical protein